RAGDGVVVGVGLVAALVGVPVVAVVGHDVAPCGGWRMPSPRCARTRERRVWRPGAWLNMFGVGFMQVEAAWAGLLRWPPCPASTAPGGAATVAARTARKPPPA